MSKSKSDLSIELETKVWYRMMKVIGWVTFITIGGLFLFIGVFFPFTGETEALWFLPAIFGLYCLLRLIGKSVVYIVVGKW